MIRLFHKLAFHRLRVALITLLCMAPSAHVLAHGGFPAVIDVAESDLLIPLSTFGIWLPADNGKYHLICEEMYSGAIEPPVAHTKEGTILVGQFKGVFRLSNDTCEMNPIALQGESLFVRAFSVLEDGTILAATSSGGKENGVFASMDDGLTWEPEPLLDSSLYYTSLKPVETGEVFTMGFSINPDTDERLAVVCERDTSAQWSCVDLAPHGSPEREQPILNDCHVERGCLFHWEGEIENTTFQWTRGSSKVEMIRENGPTPEDGLPQMTGSVFVPGTKDILVATRDGFYRKDEGSNSWTMLESPTLECLIRKGSTIYGCANPYLPNGFVLGTFQEKEDAWEAIIPNFQPLVSLLGCESQGPGSIGILCAEAWANIVETLELSPEAPTSNVTEEEPEEQVMIQDNENPTTQLQQEGCQHEGNRTPWLMGIIAMLGLVTRRFQRVPLILLATAFLLNCSGGEEEDTAIQEVTANDVEAAGDSEEQIPDGLEEADGDSEEQIPDGVEGADGATEPASPPMKGQVLLGEFQQEGNFIDENSAKGVIANTVFADPAEMTPAFDSTEGNCSFRTVAADVEIKEPLGLDGGPVSLSGPGLLSPIQFTPFDFGEAAGGVAYDHDLEDGIQTIFQPGEVVQVNVEGTDEAPPFSGETPVPGEAPIMTPPAGTLSPDDDGSITYTWEPMNSDEVLFEWDAFLEGGSAVQLRCTFSDEEGMGTVPADYVTPFLGQVFTMSVSRVNRSIWDAAHNKLEVIFSRRKVTFVYP